MPRARKKRKLGKDETEEITLLKTQNSLLKSHGGGRVHLPGGGSRLIHKDGKGGAIKPDLLDEAMRRRGK